MKEFMCSMLMYSIDIRYGSPTHPRSVGISISLSVRVYCSTVGSVFVPVRSLRVYWWARLSVYFSCYFYFLPSVFHIHSLKLDFPGQFCSYRISLCVTMRPSSSFCKIETAKSKQYEQRKSDTQAKTQNNWNIRRGIVSIARASADFLSICKRPNTWRVPDVFDCL